MSETSKRPLPFLLIGSLVLNGLLVGLLIGGGLRGGQGASLPPPDRAERALVRGLEAGVSEEDRGEVRRAFREAFASTRPQRRAIREARVDLRQALSADPYDASAVQSAFERVRAAEAASREGLHAELARQFERLSPEDRARLAAAMDRPRRRGPRGGPDDRGPRGQRPTDN